MTDPGLLRLADAVLAPGYVGVQPPAWLEEAIAGGLGAVCWFAHNVGTDPAAASAALHAVRREVLVLSDEEGGSVTRIEAAGGSSWPGNAALGRVDDTDLTREVAAMMGRQAAAAGVDVVAAPVVDVASDPANPVIGTRAFGADPGLVARHGVAFVEGVQQAGVAACAKHYPGHGATRTDSHVDLPVLDDDLDLLRERDLAPFAAAVGVGVRAVMTAHVRYPAVDAEPATTSAFWQRLLRDELGFTGVVISDALDMAAVSERVGRGPGGVAALAAGVDLLCIGNPAFPHRYDDRAAWQEVRTAVANAVVSGELSAPRLEEAAGRVADLAAWRRTQVEVTDAVVDRQLGVRVARQACEVVGTLPVLGPGATVAVAGRTNVAAGTRGVDVVAAGLVGGLALQGPVDASAGGLDRVDVLVTDGQDDDVVRRVRAASPDALVVVTGPVGVLPGLAGPAVRTYGSGPVTAAALADLLTTGAET